MPYTNSGYVPVTPTQSLANMQQVFIQVFGSNVNLTPTDINGLLIQQLTNMSIENENNKSLLYSQVYNPNLATSIWIDGLCKFNNLKRKGAIQSGVTCQVTGIPSLVIPENSLVLDIYNNIYYNPSPITIGSGGTGSGTFLSQEYGAIQCDANSINRIVQQLAGWDTINNSSAGIIGEPQENDIDLRYRRQLSLAINSTGSVSALQSSLYESQYVQDFYIVNNNTSLTITSPVTVAPNGIYVTVYGLDTPEANYAIAGIIYNNKSAGCSMTGSIDVLYTDPVWSYQQNHIYFNRPTPTPIQINIATPQFSNLTSNQINTIKNAIVANFYGTDGVNNPVTMRDPFYVSRFISTLTLLGITQILNLTVQTVTSGTPATSMQLPITEIATLSTTNVIITAS